MIRRTLKPVNTMLLLPTVFVFLGLVVLPHNSNAFQSASTGARLRRWCRTMTTSDEDMEQVIQARIIDIDDALWDEASTAAVSPMDRPNVEFVAAEPSVIEDALWNEASTAAVSPLNRPNVEGVTAAGSSEINNALWDEASTAAVSPLNKPKVADAVAEPPIDLEARRMNNIAVAVASILLAITNYLYQYTHPITPLALLVQLQSQSAPLSIIGTNNKPTVIDFWAPWCTNCQYMAGTLAAIESEYADSVNFVMVNGDERENMNLVDQFGVDAIPHMAFLDKEGNVETALIGPIPKSVMKADLDVLLKRGAADQSQEELPYVMLDAFANRPQLRKVSFSE